MYICIYICIYVYMYIYIYKVKCDKVLKNKVSKICKRPFPAVFQKFYLVSF